LPIYDGNRERPEDPSVAVAGLLARAVVARNKNLADLLLQVNGDHDFFKVDG
jgi:hypothetical protein